MARGGYGGFRNNDDDDFWVREGSAFLFYFAIAGIIGFVLIILLFVQMIIDHEVPGLNLINLGIDNIYGFVFNAEKLLNPDTYSSEYAAFIYEMKNLEKLGCSTLRTISYTGSVLKIIFTIQLGGFNIVTDKVEEWLNFTRKSNTLSVLAKKEFESKFENDLKAYNEATIKEFVEIYG